MFKLRYLYERQKIETLHYIAFYDILLKTITGGTYTSCEINTLIHELYLQLWDISQT